VILPAPERFGVHESSAGASVGFVEAGTTPPEDDTKCGPCSGTGALFSNAGGEQHKVVCPWCEGSGERLPEHDSQEAGERLREQPPKGE